MPDTAKLKVLLVEDEEYYRQVYQNALAEHFDVDTANNGEQAIALVAKNNYAVIIIDLVMPIMSGVGLLKEITTTQAKRIVLTTLEGETDKQDALSLGATKFLTKAQTTPSQLVVEVQQLVTQ